ncbi:hypothetical protein C1645_812545 [Glomus cerebriforme]|uniref:Uncharacterized protein n=1 Tax=Glomus cerebriforme TaxID=658196 RepID=A0A397TQ35_9GLOM|nr:hypothetical protein C1645_812545 [Glomus cerebriforme]
MPDNVQLNLDETFKSKKYGNKDDYISFVKSIRSGNISDRNEHEGPKLLIIYKEWEIQLFPSFDNQNLTKYAYHSQKKAKMKYEGSLKTAIKKVGLKYNNNNENTDYLKNKNYRSTSSQKLVSADDKELDESDKRDKSDKSDE